LVNLTAILVGSNPPFSRFQRRLTENIDHALVHGLEESQQILDKERKGSDRHLVTQLIHVELAEEKRDDKEYP